MFTDEDLREMFEECKYELEQLGYPLVEMTGIKFTKGAKNYIGKCLLDKKCKFDLNTFTYKNKAVRITIHGALRDLPVSERWKVKTVVMHEAIHCVDIDVHDVIEDVGISHGPVYDKIRKEVETKYGYTNIDDHDYNGLAKYIKEKRDLKEKSGSVGTDPSFPITPSKQ